MENKPFHPGAFLGTELDQRGISQSELARQSGISFQRINGIVCGRRSVTVDSALRIEQALGYPASTLLSRQVEHDLFQVKKRIGATLKKIKPLGDDVAVPQ